MNNQRSLLALNAWSGQGDGTMGSAHGVFGQQLCHIWAIYRLWMSHVVGIYTYIYIGAITMVARVHFVQPKFICHTLQS